MTKPTVLIAIDTDAETTTEAFGRSFIESLCNLDGRLVPEKISETESFKSPFRGVDDFLENWWAIPQELRVDGHLEAEFYSGPMWLRKSALASRGMVSHGRVNRKSQKIPSQLWYEARWANDVDFDNLFEKWASLSAADIGLLHLFTDAEKDLYHGPEGRSFQVGSFGGPAKPGLPNIGWAMAYGRSYAAMVDVARIKAAGFSVDERNGVAIVRVTDKLSDVVDDFAYFSQRRAALKALFPPDLFWIKEEPGFKSNLNPTP
ncbi:MAG TPA: hypothetical protein DIU09_09420 [Hyphomonadaceae bacterium]|nr:hypothetical protein AEM38_08075 [Hyphomonadaceae bacterium UKL13-1]HCP64793.1 hypothetical protein [Hyphomonadaceae bacterium]